MTVRYTVLDGEIISENRDGVERDYVPDPLGSTVALLDSNQTITDTFAYWPHGQVRNQTGSSTTPFRFVGSHGYYQDAWHRLYVRARVLHVQHARWMSLDPRSASVGRNRYLYVANNPTRWTDKSGQVIGVPILLGLILIACGAAGARNPAIRLIERLERESGSTFDKLKHCVGACIMRKCGTVATSWFWGQIRERGAWDPTDSPLDFCANNRGERCATAGRTWSDCVSCCASIYPAPAQLPIPPWRPPVCWQTPDPNCLDPEPARDPPYVYYNVP